MCKYATKSYLKKAIGVDPLDFTKKVDLSDLKSEVDNLDIDKSGNTPDTWNKLSDIVEKEVVKKTVCNELVKKIDTIQANDTSNLVNKGDCNMKNKKNSQWIYYY